MSASEGTCPQCIGPTIRRSGGEWCPVCQGWIDLVRMTSVTIAGTDDRHIRIVRRPR